MNQKETLRIVADNPALTTELKALFSRFFTVENLPLENPNLTNEFLGETVRARLEGQKLLNAAFKEIERYKTPEARVIEKNPAR